MILRNINSTPKHTAEFSAVLNQTGIATGIATDDNLSMLKAKGYDFMCVSRSSLKAYYADTTATPVQITDKRKQPIELFKVRTGGDSDQYLQVKYPVREVFMSDKTVSIHFFQTKCSVCCYVGRK